MFCNVMPLLQSIEYDYFYSSSLLDELNTGLRLRSLRLCSIPLNLLHRTASEIDCKLILYRIEFKKILEAAFEIAPVSGAHRSCNLRRSQKQNGHRSQPESIVSFVESRFVSCCHRCGLGARFVSSSGGTEQISVRSGAWSRFSMRIRTLPRS